MGHLLTDIKAAYQRGNIVIRLIFINSAIFILYTLVSVFFQLFNHSTEPLFRLLSLPASFQHLALQPWSLLTYMFMHAGILHILFNMLWLYWFGNLFLQFFSAKHLRGVYLLGGLSGGIFYLAAYHIFPYFSQAVDHSSMVGASASVLAIVLAVAYREPNYPVRLLLFGTIRLKYLALLVVIGDLLFITSDNAGGHIAHLGGALTGLLFAAGLLKGRDITFWLNRLIDGIAGLFSFSRKRRGKPKMNIKYSKHREDYQYNQQKKVTSDEVDRILEKLKRSGYESLTVEEKKRLFDASKK